MAKIIRSHTFDNDVVEALEGVKNSSKLINDLLIEYFFGTSSNKKEEINSKIKQLIDEKDKIDEKMKVLVQRYDQVVAEEEAQDEQFKDIPNEILDDFRRFKFTEESLKSRWNNVYKEMIEWEELKGLYAQFVDGKTTN